jgi:cyclopropane fatty-acyl-phospholipid synthase-like methyltransferase
MIDAEDRERLLRQYGASAFLGLATESSAPMRHLGYFPAGGRRLGWREAQERYLERLCRDVPAGSRVLDAGCGTGASSLWLARHHECRTHGFDLVDAQIQVGRRVAQKLGLSSTVTLECRDATEWEGEPQSFDHALALEFLIHIRDRTDVLARIYRATRAGGTLLISDFTFGERHSRVTGLVAAQVVGAAAHVDRLSALLDTLAEVGFRVLDVENASREAALGTLDFGKHDRYRTFCQLLGWQAGVRTSLLFTAARRLIERAVERKELAVSFVRARKPA